MAEVLTLSKAFVEAASVLRHGGIETPELDARLLVCHAASLTHEAYIAKAHDELPPATRARLDAALARRYPDRPVYRYRGPQRDGGDRFERLAERGDGWDGSGS